MNPEKVSIIVPNWNKRELLRECVGSLDAQTYRPLEVIVVDNGSEDGSVDMLKAEFPHVKVIAFPENRGFSAAVNAGISAATGGLVALVNNDADADPGWISALVEAARAHEDAGFFASKVLFHSDRNTIDTFGDGFTVAGFGYKRGWGEPSENFKDEQYVFGACGGAAMYRAGMLRDVTVAGELFDEDFFAFGEDLDLSLRARLMGYKCLAVPGAVVYHRVRATAGRGSAGSVSLSHRNFILCVMKDFPADVIIRHIFSIAAYLILAAAADMLKNRRMLYLKSYLAALRMWPRMKPKRKAIQSGSRISPAGFEDLLERRWLSIWLKLNRMNKAVKDRGL
jgi:GT2 family glycosyltransferase